MKARNPSDHIVDLDYQELFKHVEGLKIVTLVTTGRTGSDFLQSLIDGHSQVLQLAGHWNFHEFWKWAHCKADLDDLIGEFVWYSYPDHRNAHIFQFKSRYRTIERWDQLGRNRDESFVVDIDAFKRHLKQLMLGRQLTGRDFFLGIHVAYGLASGVDVFDTRLLFYHVHHIHDLAAFSKDFPDFSTICTVRDVRNTIAAGMEHWKRYDPARFRPDLFYGTLTRVFRESEPIFPYTRRILTVKLEDHAQKQDRILEQFCSTFGIDREPSLSRSTFHGKLWWADALSTNYMNGFNSSVLGKKWTGRITLSENLWIEFLLGPRLRHYGYPIETKLPGVIKGAVALLLMPLPTKYECRLLWFGLTTGATAQDKLVLVAESVFFYALRLVFLVRFTLKRLTKGLYLPRFLGM